MSNEDSIIVKGYVFSDDGARIPIEVEIDDPETIHKIKTGMLSDLSLEPDPYEKREMPDNG